MLIFTDLDGTLLDDTDYSFQQAIPALEALRKSAIPLVICSSKTRKEIEYYQKKIDNNQPFISENGGGIFIPKGYFAIAVLNQVVEVSEINDYYTVTLGAPYSELRNVIRSLREKGFHVIGFGDMTVREVSERTGLSMYEAEMAKEREFDEVFIHDGDEQERSTLLSSIEAADGDEQERSTLLSSIEAAGYSYTSGRYFHIMGKSDKGKAVAILTTLYGKIYDNLFTVAIGDNPNDVPMFEQVDYPIIVQNKNGLYDERINTSRLIKADGIGPEGWNKAIMNLLSSRP
jgi:mannosyl-3-phosphoglycerate phosphatase